MGIQYRRTMGRGACGKGALKEARLKEREERRGEEEEDPVAPQEPVSCKEKNDRGPISCFTSALIHFRNGKNSALV